MVVRRYTFRHWLHTYFHSGGITYSFVLLGIFFAIVVMIAGSLLAWPPEGYVPPAAALVGGVAPEAFQAPRMDWVASDMIKTWQFYALVFLFIGSTQSGLMIIANAAKDAGQSRQGIRSSTPMPGFWLSMAVDQRYGAGGAPVYSDKIGRANAYTVNCMVSCRVSFPMPAIIGSKSVFLLF